MTVKPLTPHGNAGSAGPPPRRLAKAVRVHVVANDPVTEAGLRSWVRTTGNDLTLVRDAAQADVVLLAVDRRTTEWIRRTIETFRTQKSDCAVVVIVDVPLGVKAPSSKDLGADAVMTRAELTPQQFIGAGLRAVGLWVPTAEHGEPEPSGVPTEAPDVLSNRERAVLRLLANGMDLAETARTLSYSERTVKNILYTLLARFGLKNRVHAVSYAIRCELI